MDFDNILEQANAGTAGAAPNTLFIQDFFHFRILIDAAVFEVTTPSLGIGIEIAPAYLRPRAGLPLIPVFALCRKNDWPKNLSTMICGITRDEGSYFYP